ncbi:MAG TPA: hypothetical protein VM261_09900 [Kofleriaceae bacterium]|nr:hypothetical protein [Kofleriaceae bacterium]
MRSVLALVALAVACKSPPPPAAPAEQVRAEPARAEPSPAEPSPAEPSPAEPSPAEPSPPLSESELSASKAQVNKLYDQQDFEGAIVLADAILAQVPDDVRMLRVATSAHCILGDAEKARARWTRLPPFDQEQIARRCARYGITLP